MSRCFIFLFILCSILTLYGCNKLTQNETPVQKNEPTVQEIVEPKELVPQKEEVILKGGEECGGAPYSTTHLAFDKDNILWIATFGMITAYYDNEFRVFDRLNTEEIPDSLVTAMFVDSKNLKWFGTAKGYVYTFDNEQWTILPVPDRIGRIREIIEDKKGVMWVAGDYFNKGDCLWNYKNGKIDKQFGIGSVSGLAVDLSNNIWASTDNGLKKYDGLQWQDIRIDGLNNQRFNGIYYDESAETMYLPKMEGIVKYHNGEAELFYSGVYLLRGDNKGAIWVAYGNERAGVSTFDGKSWRHFNRDTPLRGAWVHDIVFDEKGRVWFAGDEIGVVMLDGSKWKTLPVVRWDPRLWWRQKSLSELLDNEVSPVDIRDVLKRPIAYRGKKIKIVGTIESGFEYANMVDKAGNKLNIYPEYHPELNQLLIKSGLETEIKKSNYVEYIGYLEFGLYYGHLGGWPFQLFITEVYPYTTDYQQKALYTQKYKDYLSR